MSIIYQQELPYDPDSSHLFDKIRDLPWPIFLDSSAPHSSQGRYDILTANPFLRLVTKGQRTTLYDQYKQTVFTSNPFELLKTLLMQYQTEHDDAWPMAGGAIGFFSYDLARQLEHLPEKAQRLLPIDDMAVGLYDWAIVTDHHLKKTALLSHLKHTSTKECLQHILERMNTPTHATPPYFEMTTPFTSKMDFATYEKCFNTIKEYILAGDCYQTNLAQCFQGNFTGEAYGAFLHLREKNPAPYAAFFDLKDYQIISCSPELFIKTQGCNAITKPIKGTIKRHLDPQLDDWAAQQLKHSEKDKAENLMIVDLLRNDFGKVCQTGSINVPQLFELESFKNVHHLVSTVTGTLYSPLESIDLLTACFPGGSVTGAPKLRAMEIIEELEPMRRGIYCGCIGYIGFNGHSQFNIAIRTLFLHQTNIYAFAGGAIVHDSELEAEYHECFSKIEAIIHALKSDTR